jgi:hypothetical protein
MVGVMVKRALEKLLDDEFGKWGMRDSGEKN